MPHESEIFRRLVQHGYRVTAPRRAVVQVILGGKGYLTPAEAHAHGQAIYPRLGLVTVYRTLELLEEIGFVRRVHLEDGCHAYAPVAQSPSHHLVCQQCRQVVEFPCAGLEPLIAEVSQRTGFVVDEHLLELIGTCPACQQQVEKGGEA
jgi:Fur family ferric uptake transcriptional regulator